MSKQSQNEMESLATQLKVLKKNIILVYAFNGTGKTRLSVAYKNISKAGNSGNHAGVYYNAYSEDLFVWNNDEENDGNDIRLEIKKSSLNKYHASLDEDRLREKLAPYKPKFDFQFKFHENSADGVESIRFFVKKTDGLEQSDSPEEAVVLNPAEIEDNPIKISRGEEQIFGWCFFLTLFDIEALTGDGKQSGHFFIDDPVSSLDEHNIFVTAASLMDLIDQHYKDRKIIITTHHIGFISILADWLKKGEKSSAYNKSIQIFILKKNEGELNFVNPNNDVLLYHLELMQVIKKAIDENLLYAYHFALLRQVLENISSFLGVGRISYVLEQIGFDDSEDVTRIVNTMAHKNVFRYEAKELVPDNEQTFKEIFNRIQIKYNFVLHTK